MEAEKQTVLRLWRFILETGALKRLTPISQMAFHQFEERYCGSAMVLRRLRSLGTSDVINVFSMSWRAWLGVSKSAKEP